MAPAYPAVPSDQFLLETASLSPQMTSTFFVGSLLAVVGLGLYLLARHFPQQSSAILQRIQSFFNHKGIRHEARLERVICPHCRKGMGVYDPIYVSYQGESYIEGVCSCCGQWLRARLR